MPYIDKNSRERVNLEHAAYGVGELNYLITTACLQHIRLLPKTYETYNSIIGVLECAKQEFYRKAVAVYENEKCKLNGEVY